MSKQEQIEKMAEIINETAFVQAHEENGDEHLCEIVAGALFDTGYINGADFVEFLKSIADVWEVGIQPRRTYTLTDHQLDKALQEYLKGE